MAAGNDQRRAFVVVVDALGAGAEDDAAAYGDEGANTLLHLAEACGGLELPTLAALGLGNILELPGVPAASDPAVYGALSHAGPGKDSTSGHWELFGVVMKEESPTFADGLPPELVSLLVDATGLSFCGGDAIDGIEAIQRLGEHHLRTGEVILYTSVDSVVQLAAHEDVMPRPELYRACEQARAALTGPYAVGRVIARPFAGTPGAFERTTGRRDYALEPPDASHLTAAREAGVEVHSVGKVSDLFAGRGFDHAHEGSTNAQALATITRLAGELEGGIVVTNLIETDQLYGHRKDVEGFHRALREIDAAVGGWLGSLRDGDLLVLTGDHGVDPAMHHSDHTREKVPLLAWHRGIAGARHDGAMSDVGASVLEWCAGVRRPELPGRSFL